MNDCIIKSLGFDSGYLIIDSLFMSTRNTQSIILEYYHQSDDAVSGYYSRVLLNFLERIE